MKIYIDSNVFVSNILTNETNHKESKDFIDFLLENNFPDNLLFLTSAFTEVEIASAVFRQTKNEETARATLHKLERPWRDKFHLLPDKIDKKIKLDNLIIKLVETALRHGTTFGDSVHANVVESYNIDFLVTWNIKHFKKMEEKIKELKVITPKEMLNKLKNETTNKVQKN